MGAPFWRRCASRKRDAAARRRGWLVAGIGAIALVACGGGSSVTVSGPGGNMGPVVSGRVSMPNGQVAAAPSRFERLAQAVVARVEALVAGNVEPVGGGVMVTLLQISDRNIVGGQIQGGQVVFHALTDSNGAYAVQLPTGTDPNTCRFVVEVGSPGAQTLTRTFVYAQRADIDFQSEAAVRLILAQIKAHSTTLCSLSASAIASITDAVRASPDSVSGDSAAAINSSAEAAAAADPGVQAAIAAAIGAATPPPSVTDTAPPTDTASPTGTAAPTSTATVVPPTTTAAPPTATGTGGATHTAPPSRTSTATNTPASSVPPSSTATAPVSPTNTAPPSATKTPPPTATRTALATPTVTATAVTAAPTNTATHVSTVPATATSTVTALPTGTAAATNTVAPTTTNTAASTATLVPTKSATPTPTNTPESTSTATSPSSTNTPAATNTLTATPPVSPTSTNTPAATNTLTATPPVSPTSTNTPAATNTLTATPLVSPTSTNTPAVTNTVTATPLVSATSTNTPAVTHTATATPPVLPTSTDTALASATPTATPTTGVSCPLTPGRYTQTTTGGSLTVSTFAPFAFPAGGTTVQDVSAGDANCVHTTVVPYPGTCTGSTCTAGNTGASCTTNADCNGLTVPVFCVPSLGYTVQVTQTACGVGEIDSNGGSDFTVTENGDTSYGPLNGCSAHQATCPTTGPAPDSSGDIDITVGDGTADTCSSGTANAIVSIPVHTLTWLAADKACVGGTHNGMACTTVTNCPKACVGGTNAGMVCTTVANCPGGSCPTTTCSNSCPDLDGVYNPGTDTLITQFPQTLDLTTDTNTAQFIDNDGDGCFLSGAGPAGPDSNSGACIDLMAQTVSVAGSGTVFSSGAPLYDLLFTTEQDATITGPTASGGATCGSPPVIDFTGLAHRCIIAP